jgi:hypothetical protein
MPQRKQGLTPEDMLTWLNGRAGAISVSHNGSIETLWAPGDATSIEDMILAFVERHNIDVEKEINPPTTGWVATLSILIKHPEVDTQGAACDYVSETIRSLIGIEDWAYVPGGQPKPYEIQADYAEGQAFGADDPRPKEDP